MSREIEINKNYDEFGKSFITSRKPYQLAAIAGAFVVGVVVMLVLKPFIGTTAASYITLVVVIPLGVVGVFERHGLDFISYHKIGSRIRKYGKLWFDDRKLEPDKRKL